MGDHPVKPPFGNLWAELKRRRVIRVVAIYAVVGWIIIEVASTVLPNLNLPDWTATLVTFLIVLGFPVTVIMAWVFDAGPGGVHRTTAVNEVPDDVKSETAPAKESELTSAAVPASSPEGDRKSIAVLPFVNMSGDIENEYFSDGISEEILNLLVKLPSLKVASRTSSFLFKGKEVSIPTIAKELNVSTVLEGSIRRAGDRVRITAQLIDAASDSHLWSETYDREMKDVFAIQDDIAQSITDALEMTLTPKERRAIQNVATADFRAYDFYLRGRNYMHSMTQSDYAHAIGMFHQAIALDAKYALAYAGMADAYSHMYRYVDASQENAHKAREASVKAIHLDPDSAEARASHGLAMFISEEYELAEEEFKKSIFLNPNLFEAYYYFGLAYTSQGEFEQAADMYRNAMKMSPADYQPVVFLAQAYASLGRKHDEMKARLASIALIEHHMEMNPHDTRALCMGANQLSNIGELDKGMKMAEQALARGEDEPLVLYNIACFFSMSGDLDRAIGLLERAVESGWGDRAWLETDSDLVALRKDERFKTLLKGIH